MSKDKDQTNEMNQPNPEELRAQIEAELRAEFEAKAKEDREASEKKAKAEEDRAERELAKQERTMRAILEAEEKVHIHIPENPLNPGEVVPVGVNGVIYAIPVGQDFEVPKSIYDTWKYSYDKTREANKRMDEVLNKEIRIL